MDEKQPSALQLISKVYHDDQNVDPAPSYAVVTVTRAEAHRILTRLQTAAAIKAGMESFFSFSTQAGCVEFIESDFDAEELVGEEDYVRVPAGEFLTDEQVAEAVGELRLYGHLAEYSDEGVRFVAFATHSGDRFESAWIPGEQFEEAAGGALTGKVVVLRVTFEGLNAGALADRFDEGEGAGDAAQLASAVGLHLQNLSDDGLVLSPAVGTF